MPLRLPVPLTRIHAGTFYFDSYNGKQLKGKVSKPALKLSFEDRFIEDGWVELDIKMDTYDVFYMSSRDAFRLKLDDALKLIAFGKANKLNVTVDSEVEKKCGQPF